MSTKNEQVDVLRREADEARRQQAAATAALLSASQAAVAHTRQARVDYQKEATQHQEQLVVQQKMKTIHVAGSEMSHGYTREQVGVDCGA